MKNIGSVNLSSIVSPNAEND